MFVSRKTVVFFKFLIMVKLMWILIPLFKSASAETWFNDQNSLNSYFVSEDSANWSHATDLCVQREAKLAVILNDNENIFVHEITPNETFHWLGLMRGDLDCTCAGVIESVCTDCRRSFLWDDGTPMTYIAPWSNSHPWNIEGRNCGMMLKSFPFWVSVNCASKRNYVCQYDCGSIGCHRTSCALGAGNYHCECKPGYIGTHCNVDSPECISDPCMNGGFCEDGVNRYDCICQLGYEGTKCETDINECASNSCGTRGSCTDKVNSFTCTCECGYTGDTCEIDIDECSSNPCKHGGSCHNLICDYNCDCTDQYQGKDCEESKDQCHSGPCFHNATCMPQYESYECICPENYTGFNCETEINVCDSLSCLHNGNCTKETGVYLCSRLKDVTEKKCERYLEQDGSSKFKGEPSTGHDTSALIGGIAVVLLLAIITNVIQAAYWIRIQKKRNNETKENRSKYIDNSDENQGDIHLYETAQGSSAEYENSYQVLAK